MPHVPRLGAHAGRIFLLAGSLILAVIHNTLGLALGALNGAWFHQAYLGGDAQVLSLIHI